MASTLVQFGTGTVSVGCNKFKFKDGEPEQWYIKIHEIKDLGKPKRVGEHLEDEDVNKSGSYIMLTFPTEKQMLIVMAAFGNKTYEAIKDNWNKAASEREWKEVGSIA